MTAVSARPDLDEAYAYLVRLIEKMTQEMADPANAVAAFRRAAEAYGDARPRPPLDAVAVETLAAGGIRGEWLRTPGAMPDRRLVYLHGGGWAGGSPGSHRALTAELARSTGWSVLSVDYRLAPEDPFPAAVDDAVAAVEWAWTHGPASGGDAERLALVGDSAGANLAAAACLKLVRSEKRVPDRLALMSGMFDLTDRADRHALPYAVAAKRFGAVAEPAAIAGVVGMYAQNVPPDDPLVSPLLADRDLLARFPPTLLQVSSAEYLYHDSVRFARRLSEAEVPTRLSVWPGQPHVWQIFTTLIPESREALAEIDRFIR